MADKRIGRDEAKRQMTNADNRIKGISTIADNTARRSKIDLKKQYGTDAGNRQAVTSVDKALNSLSKTTDALAKGVKTITVETARGVKNITASGAKAMGEYARAISEDIHINRQNFMVVTIGKFTPLVGYAVAKMMETTVFKNMIARMKDGLGKALDSVTSRFKKLASMGWEKGKEFWGSAMDRISGKRGAVKTKMANARQAKQDKKYFTKESAMKDALADASVRAAAKKASKKQDIEKQVPHMASGGYVQKEGLAKVHAAEVVQPVDKMVEIIVDTVNKRLDKKEDKQKNMFEGTFLEKTKEKDFFGFDKIGSSIKSGMDIMFRKNLALEQRVMKRDKKNQQGLIGSFMTAYSQEAKQEELPLMERQVRAILELKSTISGDQKIRQAAWEKMLYEHPVFHASYLAAKGTIKTFTTPMKFLFKKRGIYSSQLSTRGTVFERLVDASSQTYQGLMTKMDDVIHNLFIIANTTAKDPKDAADAKKAPSQKGYSIAGTVAKFAYKNMVQRPAAAIGWAAKKMGSKNKTLTNERTVEGTLGDSWKETKKNYGDLWKDRGARTRNFFTDSKQTREERSLRKKRGKIYEKIKKVQTRIDKKRAKPETKRLKKADRDNFWDRSSFQNDLKKSGPKAAAERYREKKDKQKEKQLSFSSGGKDRSGKKTTTGIMEGLAKTTKGILKTNKTQEGIAKTSVKILKKAGGFMWTVLKGAMGLLSGGVGGLISLLGPVVTGILMAGAGAALGTILNKWLVKPWMDKKYKKADEKADAGRKNTSGMIKKASNTRKDYAAGKGTEADLVKSLTTTQIVSDISRNKVGKGWTSLEGFKQGSRIKDSQTSFVQKNISRYAKYGPEEVSRARSEFNSGWSGFVNNKVFMKTLLEDPEGYGVRRETAFLEYLEKNGNQKALSKSKKVAAWKNERSKSSIKLSDSSSLSKAISIADRKTYEGKVNKLQSDITKWFPTINQFAGNTAIGGLLTNYAADKSGKYPNALLNALDAVSKFTMEEWVASGGEAKYYEIAKAISTEKKSVALQLTERVDAFKATQIGKDSTVAAKGVKQIAHNIKATATGYYKEAGGGVSGVGAAVQGVATNRHSFMANIVGVADTFKGSESGRAALKAIDDRISSSQADKAYWDGLSLDEKKQQVSLIATTMKNNMETKAAKVNEKYGVSEKASTAWSNIKAKGSDLKANFIPMIMTMGDNLITSLYKLQDFFINAYGDPKQFYTDTKENLWGGIKNIKDVTIRSYDKLHDMYLLNSWSAKFQYDQFKNGSTMDYEAPPEPKTVAKISASAGVGFKFPGPKGKETTIQLTGHGGEVGFLSPVEAQERLGIMGGMNSKKVAGMGARKELFKAALQSGMMKEMSGIKESVNEGTKASIASMTSVINNTNNIQSSNTNNSGGNNGNLNPLNEATRLILSCGLT